ncbi:MAG TPA: metallophosphoesterase [Verrucomicrobiae bacterium]|nr:metallophosphoesterase [Verrucomicrobiae bacterium]
MPIYLPPISRRKFLSRSLAAAAALGLAPGCAMLEGRRNSQSIALLSDIHISADPTRVARSVNMTDHLKKVTAEVTAWPELPETVFVNGDLAFDRGETADYEAVLGLLHPLREAGMPLHLNMGNHDNREHFWGVFKRWKTIPAKLPGRQAAIVRRRDANWFLLDSLIKTKTTPGLLGEAQRAWLARSLDANADKPAIVMFHHQSGEMSPGHSDGGLEDGPELMAILRKRPHVKAYLFGHTHRWSVTTDKSGLHLVNLPAVGYVFQPDQPSGWVHATMRENGMRVELRCVDRSHPAHGQAFDLDWRNS